MKPQVTIDLEYFKRLQDIEKAMLSGESMSIEVSPYGLMYGEVQYKHTLTFYNLKKSRKKLAEIIRDMKQQLGEKDEKNSELSRQVRDLKQRLFKKEEELQKLHEDINEVIEEADKNLWGTFKNYVLGRD